MKENQDNIRIVDMSKPESITDKIMCETLFDIRKIFSNVFEKYEEAIKPNILHEALTNVMINCFSEIIGFCLLNQPLNDRDTFIDLILSNTRICIDKYMKGLKNELKNSTH